MTDKSKIANIIKKQRIENKLSQHEMAEYLNISKRQLIRIEAEEASISVKVLFTFMRKFGHTEILSLLSEEDKYDELMSEIYLLLKEPQPNIPEVSQKIYEVYDLKNFENLPELQKTNLDLIASFVNYKETENLDFLKILPRTESSIYFVENLLAMRFSLIHMNEQEIFDFLRFCQKNKIKTPLEEFLKIYLNAIGILLKMNSKRNDSLKQILQEVEETIYSDTDYYYLLPLFFRHKGIYYRNIGDRTNSLHYMEKAEQLFQLYKMEESLKRLRVEKESLFDKN